ncbi:hypothetical protein QJS04_geneDACA003536 [Acorus gramineus]|uniref:Late embryogenesis abundant protein LEA-2 subgroup domain-containing protein n=1 Tax=Acorus gramineus TaxID=55184 RepID=A0AAV9BS19_ACOGR|nr:hypothetical protein QJS04_geneDACA003536 [Acorus gramineus]
MTGDRIHPIADSPTTASTADEIHPPFFPKPNPPPGTYVIQIPKDQIFNHPPPANAALHKSRPSSTASSRRRGCTCRRCFCFSLCLLFLLAVAIAVAGAVMYFVYDPKVPRYTVDRISIKGFDLNSTSQPSDPSINPDFKVTVRADNPNKKIGFYYGKRSSASVSFESETLCRGSLVSFYHGPKNVTVFETDLIGSGIRLSESMRERLIADQIRGSVPIRVDLRVPVRAKVGAIKSWTVTVKARCELTVDRLGVDSRIKSKSCKVSVDY